MNESIFELNILWADSGAVQTVFDGVTKVLAILGAALIGAVIIGYVARLFTTLISGRTMPRWAQKISQLMGAITFGILAAFWVYGGGGTGIGGQGGTSMGAGADKNPNESDKVSTKDKINVPPQMDQPIEIEVLGKSGEQIYYLRLDQKLYSFDGLRKAVEKLQPKEKKRPMTVILYQDSPAEDKQQVLRLKEWLHELLDKPPELVTKSIKAPTRQ